MYEEMYRKSRLGDSKNQLGDGDRMFNLKRHALDQDGLLTIKASGYDDETHWTGWLAIAPAEPDYDFWYWMACVRQPPKLVQERDLKRWKHEYTASREELAPAVLA